MQEVELDSKIKLIDCPGIVFTQTKNTNQQNASNVLRNAQRVSDVKDPFPVATSILQRASKLYFCRLYGISEYDTPEEFFAQKAKRTGKFKRGGVPDAEAAARSLLNDWNTGKIKYCTQPPEADSDVHISAAIVSDAAREFDIDNFEQMETEVLDNFVVKAEDALEYKSTGPVNMQTFADDASSAQIIEGNDGDEDMDEDVPKAKRTRKEAQKAKIDPQLLIEGMDYFMIRNAAVDYCFSFTKSFSIRTGNQTTNKDLKRLRKQQKKTLKRSDKKVSDVADVLENFTLDMGTDDYDFKVDYDD